MGFITFAFNIIIAAFINTFYLAYKSANATLIKNEPKTEPKETKTCDTPVMPERYRVLAAEANDSSESKMIWILPSYFSIYTVNTPKGVGIYAPNICLYACHFFLATATRN